jgi:hypothetical protein
MRHCTSPMSSIPTLEHCAWVSSEPPLPGVCVCVCVRCDGGYTYWSLDGASTSKAWGCSCRMVKSGSCWLWARYSRNNRGGQCPRLRLLHIRARKREQMLCIDTDRKWARPGTWVGPPRRIRTRWTIPKSSSVSFVSVAHSRKMQRCA